MEGEDGDMRYRESVRRERLVGYLSIVGHAEGRGDSS